MFLVLQKHSAHLECKDGVLVGIVLIKGANFTIKGLTTLNTFKARLIVRRAIIVLEEAHIIEFCVLLGILLLLVGNR